MTIIIGANLDDQCSIIVADKRESYMLNEKVVNSVDTADKIINTPLGFVTGSGAVSLLSPVKEAIKSEIITHTDEIIDIIFQERLKMQQDPFVSPKQKEFDLKTTGWLLSYNGFVDGSVITRTVVSHPSFSVNQFRVVNANTSFIIYPNDMSEEDQTKCRRELPEELKKLLTGDFNKDVSTVISQALKVIFLASERSNTVSKFCDIAIQNGKMNEKLIAENVTQDMPNLSFRYIS